MHAVPTPALDERHEKDVAIEMCSGEVAAEYLRDGKPGGKCGFVESGLRPEDVALVREKRNMRGR